MNQINVSENNTTNREVCSKLLQDKTIYKSGTFLHTIVGKKIIEPYDEGSHSFSDFSYLVEQFSEELETSFINKVNDNWITAAQKGHIYFITNRSKVEFSSKAKYPKLQVSFVGDSKIPVISIDYYIPDYSIVSPLSFC